jgi:hypothetical protein
MKDEDGSISGRQFENRFIQREPIEQIGAPWNALHDRPLRHFTVFG